MTRRSSALLLAVALSSLTLCAPGSAHAAQTLPGVGYDVHAKGLSVSRYQLDNLFGPFSSYVMNFSARPDLVGASPNPYYLNLGDPAVKAAYELRWGPNTTSNRFKRWQGPNNEVRSVVKDALAWAFVARPDLLGGSPAGFNGAPTEVEITDAQAVNDRALYTSYLVANADGFSPATRVEVCDPSLPPGDVETQNTFWSMTFYVHNNYQAPLPVSPQVATSSCTP